MEKLNPTKQRKLKRVYRIEVLLYRVIFLAILYESYLSRLPVQEAESEVKSVELMGTGATYTF